MIQAAISLVLSLDPRRYSFLLAAGACLSLLGLAYLKGWVDRGTEEAHRIAVITAERRMDAARIMGQAEALQRLQEERDRLEKELENEARADPAANTPSLGADSVRRLNLR